MEPEPVLPNAGLSGFAWPALPVGADAAILSVLFQLDQSECWPDEMVLESQMDQLRALIGHAAATVPHYRRSLREAAAVPPERWGLDVLGRLPILDRGQVRRAGGALLSRRIPKSHGPVTEARTAGTTAGALPLKRTRVEMLFRQAFELRHHFWHGRDLAASAAAIDAMAKGESGDGPPWAPAHPSPSLARMDLNQPAPVQWDWLVDQAPAYLMTPPSNLEALIHHARAQDARLPGLRQVVTSGEVLDPGTRAAAAEVLGVSVADVYRAEEVGIIAVQCPEHDHYHVQSENLFAEVLDLAGRPCGPGAIGRVVVSTLHNFAQPLIRYDTGDFAEVGAPSDCGRTLPVLTRILGRARNRLNLPTGEPIWPDLTQADYRTRAPVRHVQLAQTAKDEIELRGVADRPLKTDEEKALAAFIAERLGHDFALSFQLGELIPRARSGRFEPFLDLAEAG